MVLAPTLIWMLIAGCCWLGCSERGGGIRILEREILDVLREDVELCLCLLLAGLGAARLSAIGRHAHGMVPPQRRPDRPQPPGWLTQGVRPDKDRVDRALLSNQA